jgi:hypothetical protein
MKHQSGAYGQIFIAVRNTEYVGQLRVCWRRALSLTRGWVSRLQLLLTLASAVILGSESRGTRDHILLSQIWDFPFRPLNYLSLSLSLMLRPTVSRPVCLGIMSLSLMLRPTVSWPVCLSIEHPSGAYDQILFPFGIRNTSDSCVLDSVGHSLWREDGSVFCMCLWSLPAQSSRVLVPWDLRPYFTVSDLRLPF